MLNIRNITVVFFCHGGSYYHVKCDKITTVVIQSRSWQNNCGSYFVTI